MALSSTRILLVEDDQQIRGRLAASLTDVGHAVEEAGTVMEARAALDRSFDLVLLDLGLPDEDGLDLCRELRRDGNAVPIIIITARDATHQRVRGLDLGADDYVAKPFQLEELFARIRSVLRRTGNLPELGRASCGELWADPETRAAGRGEREIRLKPREFDLLLFLLRHPERVWTRDQLLDRVWESDADGGTRKVDLHVRRLRAQVEDDPGDPQFIKTVWGVGYRMSDAR